LPFFETINTRSSSEYRTAWSRPPERQRKDVFPKIQWYQAVLVKPLIADWLQ